VCVFVCMCVCVCVCVCVYACVCVCDIMLRALQALSPSTSLYLPESMAEPSAGSRAPGRAEADAGGNEEARKAFMASDSYLDEILAPADEVGLVEGAGAGAAMAESSAVAAFVLPGAAQCPRATAACPHSSLALLLHLAPAAPRDCGVQPLRRWQRSLYLVPVLSEFFIAFVTPSASDGRSCNSAIEQRRKSAPQGRVPCSHSSVQKQEHAWHRGTYLIRELVRSRGVWV